MKYITFEYNDLPYIGNVRNKIEHDCDMCLNPMASNNKITTQESCNKAR